MFKFKSLKSRSALCIERVQQEFVSVCSWATPLQLQLSTDLSGLCRVNIADPLYHAQRLWVRMHREMAEEYDLQDRHWRLCRLLDGLDDSQWELLALRIHQYRADLPHIAGQTDMMVRVAWRCWQEEFAADVNET